MSWQNILKKEQEVFDSLDEVTMKYKRKISSAINLLKKMKKEITIENIKDEIVEPLRPEVYGTFQKEFTLKEKVELIKLSIKRLDDVEEHIKNPIHGPVTRGSHWEGLQEVISDPDSGRFITGTRYGD